jgi:hypothetical protein
MDSDCGRDVLVGRLLDCWLLARSSAGAFHSDGCILFNLREAVHWLSPLLRSCGQSAAGASAGMLILARAAATARWLSTGHHFGTVRICWSGGISP